MLLQHLLGTLVVATAGPSATQKCPPFPTSLVEFSSGFHQPPPPLIKPEFNTSFIQHKWNQDVSRITAGYMTNSPSSSTVRVDEAYKGGLASSLFNYANVTDDGLVDNTLTTFVPPDSVTVWRGYVSSNFPLFSADFLVSADAVFAGLATRDLVPGKVALWNIMYQGVIPVTICVDACGVVVGYDYFTPGLRTRVVNLFFNTQIAEIHV
ncbi:hypothetical protein OQA88_7189 [Cercophora sp. LCS_1]